MSGDNSDKTALWVMGSAAALGLGVAVFAGTRPEDSSEEEDRVTAEDVPHPVSAEPRQKPGKRLTRSTVLPSGTVRERPSVLLHEARMTIPSMTLDELTAARLAASEHASGTEDELRAIIDAELNRAEHRGQSLTRHLTSLGADGRQGTKTLSGKRRPASTARDARMRHYQAARDVLSGAARGIARGAVRFFDPVAQLAAWKRWSRGESPRRHCHPRVILERWSLNLPWAKGGDCMLDLERPGHQLQEWVGEVDGIDPLRLMLFRPATKRHKDQLHQARSIIDTLG